MRTDVSRGLRRLSGGYSGAPGQLEMNLLSGPAMRSLNMGVALLSYPIYLHSLGFQQYGLWLVLSTVLMISQLGNLGVVQALAKVVAEEHGAGHVLAIRQYSTFAAAVLAASGAALTVAVVLLRDPIVALLGLDGPAVEAARRLLPYCALLSAYVFVADAQTNVLAGLGRMDVVNGLQTVTQATAVGLGILALRHGYGVPGLLAASMAARVLQHGAACALASRILRAPLFTTAWIPRARARRLAETCSGLFGATIVNLLLTPFNRVMITRFAGLQAVPVYEIAFNGAMQVRSLFAAASGVVAPETSRLAAASPSSGDSVRRLNRYVIRLLVCVGGPAYALLWFGSSKLLDLWLGGKVHPDQAVAFHIALAGSFFSLLGTVPYHSLLGLHRSRSILYSHLAQSSANAAIVGAIVFSTGKLTVPAVVLATSVGMGVCAMYLFAANRAAVGEFERGSRSRVAWTDPIFAAPQEQ